MSVDQRENFGRKRKSHPDKWQRDLTKLVKVEGGERKFSPVVLCCKRNCCSKYSHKKQSLMYAEFWALKDTNIQNQMLSNLLFRIKPRTTNSNPKSKNRQNSWKYYCNFNGVKSEVCKEMICSLYQIGKKRIEVIQQKMCKGVSVGNNTGKHTNRPNRLDPIEKKMIFEFCKSFEFTKGHYLAEPDSSNDSTLNSSRLHEFYASYYKSVTEKDLKMSCSSFKKYFNENLYIYNGRILPRC